VIEPLEQYSIDELQEAANYLNTEFSGRSLEDVRLDVLQRLREERTLYDQLMARALRLASTSFETLDPQPSIFIQGTSLLLDMSAVEDPETTIAAMRTLVRMMEEKSRLVKLIDACVDARGLRVVIGSEHGDPELQHFSVIATVYSDGRRTGAVGVIGPTRMRYSRSINVVDSLSRALTRVFDADRGQGI
jgi:heat-inducible transcriptional repressor